MARKERNVSEVPPEAQEPPPKTWWLHTFGARVAYWLTWVVAVLALNRLLHFLRVAAGVSPTLDSRERGVFFAVVALLLLAGALCVLALYSYENLRWRGQLARRARWFERLLGGPKE